MIIPLLLSLAASAALPAPAATVVPAQERAAPTDTFLDETARRLLGAARASRREQSAILEYTALVRERMAIRLRTPLRDRTLFRLEGASKVRWTRDGPDEVRVLASRVQSPLGTGPATNPSGFSVDELFDPANDPLTLGIREHLFDDDGPAREEMRHPLDDDAGSHYRFRTGDTLRIRLAGGRVVEAVELEMLPREASPLALSGSLWIEPGSGALVQAVYRLADEVSTDRHAHLITDPDLAQLPPGLRPLRAELRVMVVEYSLWEYTYWLPHRVRADVVARAGPLTAPGTLEVTYDILQVVTPTDTITRDGAAAEHALSLDPPEHRTFRRRQDGDEIDMRMPLDPASLLASPWLPPPIWDDDAGYVSEDELREIYRQFGSEHAPAARRPHFAWIRPHDRLDLVRYNRVEGLSVGVRLHVVDGPRDAELTVRAATADLVPRSELRLGLDRLHHAMSLRLYHATAAVASREPRPGNTLSALLLGRDEEEYYRAAGLSLEITPTSSVREWYAAALFAERQRPLDRRTTATLPGLWSDARLRPNIDAAPVDLAGARLALRPWWGTDPDGPQAGLDLGAELATGDASFARLTAALRALSPQVAAWRAGLLLQAGTLQGDTPPQRLFYLGGAGNLAGYPAAVRSGRAFARGRAEVGRDLAPVTLTLFGDAGWAGTPADFDTHAVLPSVGIGISTLDGLVRLDLARSLKAQRKFRLEIYLEGLL